MNLGYGTIRVSRKLQRVDGKLVLVDVKSSTALRTIGLPDVAARALRDHRRRQLEERLAAGPLWQGDEFVFATQIGTPLDARNVMREFAKLRERAGMPWLTFHGLRHGFGSLLAAQGVHPRLAMELMGQSQISLTMEIYTHIAPELARETAAKIDTALTGG